jgi:inhibitor of KinA sporulation pathway (predicted exonuclease)
MPKRKRNVLVVDLEATCWEDGKYHLANEIIEIGITTVEVPTRKIIGSRSIYVRPWYEKISEFCTQLTGITQDYIDKFGTDIYRAFTILREEYDSPHSIWMSWGSWDRKLFEQECTNKHLIYPFSKQHINVKALFGSTRSGHGCGLGRACKILGIPFEGRPHTAIADSYNTAKVWLAIINGETNHEYKSTHQGATRKEI